MKTREGRGKKSCAPGAVKGGPKPAAELPAAVPSFVPHPDQPGASRGDQSRWLNYRERSRLATGTQHLQPGRQGRGLGKGPHLGRQQLELLLFFLHLRLSRRLQRCSHRAGGSEKEGIIAVAAQECYAPYQPTNTTADMLGTSPTPAQGELYKLHLSSRLEHLRSAAETWHFFPQMGKINIGMTGRGRLLSIRLSITKRVTTC